MSTTHRAKCSCGRFFYGTYPAAAREQLDLHIQEERLSGKNLKTLGQVAYEGYLTYSDGKSLKTGEPLPTWIDQGDDIKSAWEFSARDVIDHAVRNEFIRIRNDKE